MIQEKITVLKNGGLYTKPLAEIILHGIYTNRKKCGVYKIMYGDKFYIGQSFHVLNRAKQHRTEINKNIFNYGKIKPSYIKVVNHFKSQPINFNGKKF